MTTKVLRSEESAWRGKPPAGAPTDLVQDLTEVRHAERFAAHYFDRLRYDYRRSGWLLYDSPLWRRDADGAVVRLAMEFARLRQREALDVANVEARSRVVQFGIQCESKAAIDRLIGLARAIKPLADAGDRWDADPWVVGSPTGLIDLQAGTLLPGDPVRRITMTVGAAYDPQAPAPRWIQFIEEIFDGDAVLIAFVKRFVGYALVADTREQVCGLCYGTGANGKTTFLNALSRAFGTYACNVPFSTLELRGRANIPNDVAVLEGKRLVTASETSEAARLNEARLKALTGSDPVTARFLYGEPFTFRPMATILLAVNHKPLVHDDSFGFWRRILLIPFTRCFSGSQRDATLEHTLQTETSGILRWVVEGCLTWQTEGLNPPACVRQATDEYREDSDPLADFLSEVIDLDPAAITRASTLHAAYQKWADAQGLGPHDRLSQKSLSQRLADRFPRRHDRAGWVYEGIRVATDRMF